MEFTYQIKNKAGKTIKGVVEAETKNKAISLLKEKGYYIISLKQGVGFQVNAKDVNPFSRISRDETVIFTRQLATMINAGLPLNDALFSLQEQVGSKFAAVIKEILERVEAGQPLGKAISGWPNVFNQVYIASVEAGEAAGVLDKVLLKLADDLEEEKKFRGEIKGALIYPIIIVVMMTIVGAIMMIFVIPKMMALYSELDADLPTATKMLMSISDFAVRFWWLVIVGLGGLVYAFYSFKKTEEGRKKIDELALRVPVLGPLQKKTILANTTRTLGLLLGTVFHWWKH